MSGSTSGGGATGARGVLPAGARLRQYEIVAVLGQGAFGVTYAARDSQLGRDVAIKEYLPVALAVREDRTTVLPRGESQEAEFNWGRERFLDEARTLAGLHRAPAIVRVFDFLEANGTAYIVMERLVGETLEARLAAGPIGHEATERLLLPLLDGLEQVHRAGFLHRDIKPANILLDEQGRPTLIDFGAARAAMGDRTSMTAVFTPGYAAVEQFTSGKQGPWTDLYALAATLHHAITGRAPPSAIDRMLDDAYRPLADEPPRGFPRAFVQAIDAALAVRASERPQDVAAWRALLAGEATIALPRIPAAERPASASTAPAALPPRPRARLSLLAAATLTLLLLAGGGAWLGLAPERAPAATAEELARRQAEAVAERAKTEEEMRRRIEAEAEERRRQEATEAVARRSFDGTWATTQSCPTHESGAGYTYQFDLEIRDGVITGQHGTSGAPNSSGYHGQIRGDGSAWINARGISAVSTRGGTTRGGTAYSFTVNAQFGPARGTGSRIGGRPCEFVFVKGESAAAPPAAVPAPAAAPPQTVRQFDGDYVGEVKRPTGAVQPLSVRVVDGAGTGSWQAACGVGEFTFAIAASGDVSVRVNGYRSDCSPHFARVNTRLADGSFKFPIGHSTAPIEVTLTRQAPR